MRVLVADNFAERQLDKLMIRGHDLRYKPRLTSQELADAVADADVLVVRSTRVTAETLRAGERLGLVIRAGAGVNTIDVNAASSRGVFVCNVPGMNAVAVAELTMGLILAIDRRIPDNVAELRAGRWSKTELARARGLKGRSIGIIGMGTVGTEVVVRARAFGMKVHGLERSGRPEEVEELLAEQGVRLHADLESLLPECDIVSIHLPSTPETMGFVDARFLSLMSRGSVLVNTSRSDLVVAEDLLEAIEANEMWAAMDVFPNEPESGSGSYVSELTRHPRVYGTHHIGASTDQAQEAIAKQVVKIIDEYGDGGIRNAVNLEQPSADTAVIGVRRRHQVGALSQIFAVLSEAGISVEHMENHVFNGARAARAVIHLRGDLTHQLVKEIGQADGVIDVTVLRGRYAGS